MFNQPVRQSHYEQALVCLNGHLITDHLLSAPQRAAPFCKKCGAETISECPSCTAPIQGNYIVPNVIAKSSYRRATYCPHCGFAMPWTVRALEAASAATEDLYELSAEERAALQRTLPDLLADTAMTPVAAGRFKRLLVKAGGGAAEVFHDLLVDVMSEAAKKAIWG